MARFHNHKRGDMMQESFIVAVPNLSSVCAKCLLTQEMETMAE